MNNQKIGPEMPTEQTLAQQHIAAKNEQRERLEGLAFAYESIAIQLYGNNNPESTGEDLQICLNNKLTFEQELNFDWNETNTLIFRLNQALERIQMFI